MKFIKCFLILFSILSKAALAEEFQAKFQDWSVFKTNQDDKVICYIMSSPIKRDDNLKERGESFFIVTSVENDADEVSVSSGIEYKEKSDVEISFGSTKFYLFPYLAKAWANDKNDDIEIIKQMQENADLVIRSVAKDNKIFHDTYSLIGFNQSYLKMKTICKD